VVDDEPSIVDALCNFLELQYVDSHRANDGIEALGFLNKGFYDAVISDIRMPGLDGPSLYEAAIQQCPPYRNRFIFMSGDLMRNSSQAFVSSIDCPCLSKPFPLHILQGQLTPLLDGFSDRSKTFTSVASPVSIAAAR
jgi:CheY-like chemotaxis protein